MELKSMNIVGTGKQQNAMRWHYTEGFTTTCADSKGP